MKVSYSLGPASAFTRQTLDLSGNRGAYYAEAGLYLERARGRRSSSALRLHSEEPNVSSFGIAVGFFRD